jgi:hypothetical protein
MGYFIKMFMKTGLSEFAGGQNPWLHAGRNMQDIRTDDVANGFF